VAKGIRRVSGVTGSLALNSLEQSRSLKAELEDIAGASVEAIGIPDVESGKQEALTTVSLRLTSLRYEIVRSADYDNNFYDLKTLIERRWIHRLLHMLRKTR
jgi:hypothetical protein